jgi:hypothetical protein
MIDVVFGWTTPGIDYDAKVLGQVDRSIALARDDPLPYGVKSYYLVDVHRPDEPLRAADGFRGFERQISLLLAKLSVTLS